MQKILVIAGGAVSHRFVERLKSANTDKSHIEIVCADGYRVENPPGNWIIHKFDPTSEIKLKKLKLQEAGVVFVALQNPEEAKTVITFLRGENSSASVIALDMDGIDGSFIEKYKIKVVSAKNILSNMLMSFLPDTPLIAQNIGKGRGEIMEVMVPYGSKYVLRHVSQIEQKNWKIAAIYRNEQLILPKQSTVIKAQDELILVGQPAILKDVYKAIKSEIGQFPQPFGANLYLFLDLSKITKTKLSTVAKDAIGIYKGTSAKKLFIKAVNPSSYEHIKILREIKADGVIVEFDFRPKENPDVLKADVKKYNIGLIMFDRGCFDHEIKKAALELQKPVLKFGKRGFFDDSYSAVVAFGLEAEKISYVFFDLSIQLNLDMKLFDYDPEENHKTEVVEHYASLSGIYSKKLAVAADKKNFLREASSLGNFIQFLPFNEDFLKFGIGDFFKPSNSTLFLLLKDNHQLFIPTSD
jgi:hypothetical protein